MSEFHSRAAALTQQVPWVPLTDEMITEYYTERFRRLVVYIHSRYDYDWPTCEDIVQDAFVEVWKHQERLNGARLHPVMCWRVRCLAYRYWYRQWVKRSGDVSLSVQMADGDELERTLPVEFSMEERLELQEEVSESLAVWQTLPQHWRTALLLSVQGRTSREIVQELATMGNHVGNERSVIHMLRQARQVLRARREHWVCRVCGRADRAFEEKGLCRVCARKQEKANVHRLLRPCTACHQLTDYPRRGLCNACYVRLRRANQLPAKPAFSCRVCGRNDRLHQAQGMCVPCYNKWYAQHRKVASSS
jgi:DNA-directed RNA polymerase specialized sigma24 family protein